MTAGRLGEQCPCQAATDAATPGSQAMRIVHRCAALTGAAYVVLANVGNAMSTDAGPPPNPAHSPGQQDLDYLHWLAGSASARVALTLELLGFTVWMLW